MEEVKKGYKKTKIGVIPEDWEVKRLGEVGKIKMCKRVFKQQTLSNGEIPFFKIGTFGNKKADAFITRSLYVEYKSKYPYPKRGDILISASGTIGRKVIYNNEEAYFQDSNIVWIDNKEKIILNKFLYYIYDIINWNKYIENTTIARLYNNNLRNIPVPLPPLKEQEKIARILLTWDKAIATQEKLVKEKEKLKTTLMQKLLSRKVRFKEFSEEWKEVRLGNICKFQKGTSFSMKDLIKGNIPVIAGGKEPAYFHNKSNRKGNVITVSSSGANAGFINFWEKEIFASDSFTIEGKKDIAYTKYIFFYLKNIQNKIYSFQSGGAQPHIYPKDLQILKIILPPLKEQQKIAKVLSTADKEIELLKNELKELKKQKKALMQKLLTGKVRVKV